MKVVAQSLCFLLGMLFFLSFTGCVGAKLVMQVPAGPDSGERVETRSRYRISGYIDKMTESYVTVEGRDRHVAVMANVVRPMFEKYQPGTFASDGIPVVIDGSKADMRIFKDHPLGRLGYLINGLLFAPSIGIIPLVLSDTAQEKYAIESVNDRKVDQKAVVGMNYFEIHSLVPFFGPICYSGVADESKIVGDQREFPIYHYGGKSKDGVYIEHVLAADERIWRAVAYAIAERLKQMERSGMEQTQERGGTK